MKKRRGNLRTDTEAASEVIGIVLIIAILVTMFTIFQASVVPYWNKQVEAAEIKVTYDDMMFLPSDIEDVAIHRTPKTCTVQLGAQYPDRMIFRNPGPGTAGTLAVEEEPASVTVTYYNGSTHTETFDSKRITYQMAGTINSPTLVYEHGAIITDWGTKSVTTDEQTLIDRNEDLFIPIVNGSSHSKSAIGSETMAIYPYLYKDSTNISGVNVTLDTRYPQLWKDTLFNASTVLEELNLQNTNVSFGDNTIYINNTAPRYLKLPNQTASGPLHAGMISCTVEDPDGSSSGGGDSSDEVGDYTGIGDGALSSGSQWWNIPGSTEITKMDVTRIVYDETESLGSDVILVTVTDNDGDWWKVILECSTPPKVSKIYARSGTTSQTSTHSGPYPINLPLSNPIDLLSISNYDKDNACYQNAAVDRPNCLVTYLGDESSLKHRALVFYEMTIE